MANVGPFESIEQIKRANAEIGHHFFDADTLRFFRSHVSPEVYGGRFFVTSEKPPYGDRAFTVRMARDSGEVRTIGEFCARAKGAAHRLARACAEDADPLAELVPLTRARLEHYAATFDVPAYELDAYAVAIARGYYADDNTTRPDRLLAGTPTYPESVTV
ncbi:MAG: hypothetical protein WC211_03820 [Dehalococcoidia bacterium]